MSVYGLLICHFTWHILNVNVVVEFIGVVFKFCMPDETKASIYKYYFVKQSMSLGCEAKHLHSSPPHH